MAPEASAAVAASVDAEPSNATLKNRLGRIWVYVIGAGTAAEILGKVVGSVEKVYHTVAELLPAGWFDNIHRAMVIVVGVALMVGYVAAVWWVFLRHRDRPFLTRVAYAGGALVLLCGMAWINYRILPERPDVNKYVRGEQAEWVQRIVSRDPANGGIPVTAFENDAPTQVWTSGQALTAVLTSTQHLDANTVKRVRRAFAYVEAARLPDQGWGYFEDWPFGVTEINAWVTLAEIAAVSHDELWSSPAERTTMVDRIVRDLATVQRALQPDGGWSPVIAEGPQLSRTYSTVLAVWALFDATDSPTLAPTIGDRYRDAIQGGVTWMLNNVHADVEQDASTHVAGWVANPFRHTHQEYFLGLNAQVLYVMSKIRQRQEFRVGNDSNYNAAVDVFLAQRDRFGRSDIGRNDRLHDTDRYIRAQRASVGGSNGAVMCTCPVTVEGSTFLWYPWSVAAAQRLSVDNTLSSQQRQLASADASLLLNRLPQARGFVGKEMNYVTAEFLIAVRPL
jgi:hypothetical protein